MRTHKNIEIPTTVSDWQLYEMPGAGRAAQALTTALKRAITRVEKGLGSGEGLPKAIAAGCGLLREAMAAKSEFGASDTEPRYVGGQALVTFVKQHLYGETETFRPEIGDLITL